MARDPADPTDPVAFVFAPSPLVTVTIESLPDERPDVHIHAGGQGVWIGRMAQTLGLSVRLTGAFGPESGQVLIRLIEQEELVIRAVTVAGDNGVYIHDRRDGAREELVQTTMLPLTRHEVDDLFTAALAEALMADVCVLAGPHFPDLLPDDFYQRLAADLNEVGKPVVADASGDVLSQVVAGGLTVLKVSHEELLEDGLAKSDSPKALVAAMRSLHEKGAEHVVVSRAEEPAYALVGDDAGGDDVVQIIVPSFNEVDHRGAGDSMTAGIAVGLARGLDMVDAVRLGAAAGAQNITRRGLATGTRDLIERVADLVVVEPLKT